MLQPTILKKKAFFTVGFFFIYFFSVYGQTQIHLDSLATKYNAGNYKKEDKLKILRELAEDYLDPDKKLAFSEALIQAAQSADSTGFLCVGFFHKGTALRLKGDLSKALENYFKAAKIARKDKQSGEVYISIADVYSIIGNHTNAVDYYQKSIAILREEKDSVNIATALYNLGDEYIKIEKLDSALRYTRESQTIFNRINSEMGEAYCLGNIGIIYSKLGDDKQAESNLNRAILLLEEMNEYHAICEFLVSMSDIYLEKGDQQTAMNYARRSLQLAEQYGLKEQISDADEKLSDLYENAGDHDKALQYYKNYILYRDSVNNIQSVQKMADLRTNFEVSRKQVEVDLLNQQRRNQRILMISLFIILGLAFIILGTLYWYYKTISREKKRSESLLLNILPAETAEELKHKGKVDAVKLDEVTVLFTDFVSFSKLAEHIEPVQLVKSIDFYFKGFDEIATKYGLEKIKTIGDSYMCACGLPTANPTHARNVVLAAREMNELVSHALTAEDGFNHFQIRIGIHSGPVVAGIVGIKKWQYDIWGDTVNIASRMESKSEPGRINLSETTYLIIKDEFPCEYRGEIEVKNRGLLKMYFLS
ncbi:MAG TPA: adenylate/guanylate cyclase domain-containing protein [Ginsengibacter sp.]